MPLGAILIPQIDPSALELGPFSVRWYALAYITGILFAWFSGVSMARNPNLWLSPIHPAAENPPEDVIVFFTIGIIVGGRLGYVLFYDLPFFITYPSQIFFVWNGGMSFHGGLMGLACTIFLLARWQRLPFLSIADIISSLAPVGIFLGRIGNFINGEISGTPSDLPWAVILPDGDGIPRHPTQIYEALLEGLLLFVVLRFIVVRYKALSWPGLVSGCFALGYGTVRIFAEYFRAPDPLSDYPEIGIHMGTVLTIPLLFLGGFLIVRAMHQGPRLEWN